MGCIHPQPKVNDPQANSVDKFLNEAKQEESNHYKILLLGPGEAGKSTLFKQLKLIYKVRCFDLIIWS